MPIKRRNGKRRASPIVEASAWGEVFSAGHDFFSEAADFTGLTEPVHVWPPEARADAEKAWVAAAADAWRRVGAVYLHHVHDPADGAPWALEQFAEPPCR